MIAVFKPFALSFSLSSNVNGVFPAPPIEIFPIDMTFVFTLYDLKKPIEYKYALILVVILKMKLKIILIIKDPP